MHSSFPTMKGKFPSNVLWLAERTCAYGDSVPLPSNQSPHRTGCLGLLGLSEDTLLLFDFGHTPGQFLLSLHPCPAKLCRVSNLPHLQNPVTPRVGGNDGASFLHPAFFPSLCLPRPTSSKSDLISESRFLSNNFTKA